MSTRIARIKCDLCQEQISCNAFIRHYKACQKRFERINKLEQDFPVRKIESENIEGNNTTNLSTIDSYITTQINCIWQSIDIISQEKKNLDKLYKLRYDHFREYEHENMDSTSS